MEECYRCGYCCKHFEIPKGAHNVAADLDIPLKATLDNPCPHLREISEGFYKCDIHEERFYPWFCEDGPEDFKDTEGIPISEERLEEKLLQGKDLPKCIVAKILGKEYLPKVGQKDLKH